MDDKLNPKEFMNGSQRVTEGKTIIKILTNEINYSGGSGDGDQPLHNIEIIGEGGGSYQNENFYCWDNDDQNLEEPNEIESHSIEIFFGNFKSFETFYKRLCSKGFSTYGQNTDSQEDQKIKRTYIRPNYVKRLTLVSHPIESLKGLNHFNMLQDLMISNCKIRVIKWADFAGINNLQRLYLSNCKIEKVETLEFQNLKILWLCRNQITSLEFLAYGLSNLNELNVAKNKISFLKREHFLKCQSLQSLNLSGNLICHVIEISALRCLKNLKELYLMDHLYGKCPIAQICESRTIILSYLKHLKILDGKGVTPVEISGIKEYIVSRCLFYYVTTSMSVNSKIGRKASMLNFSDRQIKEIAGRMNELIILATKCRRVITSVDIVPIFSNAKNMLKDQLTKVEYRIQKLKDWTNKSIKRLELIVEINQWEQEVEKWMKWIEFQTYGQIICQLALSVHSSTRKEPDHISVTMHQLLSALSCPGLWPESKMIKVENVITIKNKGVEAGMEQTYLENYAINEEPKFVAPPQTAPIMTNVLYCPYTMPLVTTFTTPDYKPPEAKFPFPDSVPGLPERAQPLFLFLIVPENYCPINYLHKILTTSSINYKDIRLTNCVWHANQSKNAPFTVLIVVKVLEECLLNIKSDLDAKNLNTSHSWDCRTFGLRKGTHSFTPAYLLSISFTSEDKGSPWQKVGRSDKDVIVPTETLLKSIIDRINTQGSAKKTSILNTKCYFTKRTNEGIHADLSAFHLEREASAAAKTKTKNENTFLSSQIQTQTSLDVLSITEFIGQDITKNLSSLNLSGNKLGLTTGLEGLTNLKRLNLSCNNLTTLSGLKRLPELIELKVGYNSLKYFHTNLTSLARATPQLKFLDILPNPFQDIRSPSHIPLLVSRVLPNIKRIDVWAPPFISSNQIPPFNPPIEAERGIKNISLIKKWVGIAHKFNELSGKCLTHLNDLNPKELPIDFFQSNGGVDLNLSNNYLTTFSLKTSVLSQSESWSCSIVKLQLQENMLTNMSWMNVIWPSLQILDLSFNLISDLEQLSNATPSLRHLHISGNPLPSNLDILRPLTNILKLTTLDASRTSVSAHPEYGIYIIKNIPSIHMLDGLPINNWNLANSVEKYNGKLCGGLLEEKLGRIDFSNLSQLSLRNCNLQRISIPSHSLQKLVSLDLQDNYLTSLSNLASLLSLRVLSLSHNKVTSFGEVCPLCYSYTANALALKAQKIKHPGVKNTISKESDLSSTSESFGEIGQLKSNLKSSPSIISNGSKMSKSCNNQYLFPKLEVLILEHNGISALNHLHLHAMPNLHTVLLNSNNINSLDGLHDLHSIKAIVLDYNRLQEIPNNSFSDCKSLRYLHLEHNRIAVLPRLPHLQNLSSLHLSFNKINNFIDLNAAEGNELKEFSVAGNPVSERNDYRLGVAHKLSNISILDGKHLHEERVKLKKLKKNWYPETDFEAYVIKKYSTSNIPNF